MGTPDDPESAAQRLAMTDVSRTLKLMEHDQDWGLANGVGERLEEFTQFLREGDFASTVVLELVDLILSSANERLVEGGTFDQDAAFGAIAARERRLCETQVEYWGSLHDTDEGFFGGAEVFPIAPLVKAWFADRA